MHVKAERKTGASLMFNQNSKPDFLLGIHPGNSSKEKDVSMDRGGMVGRENYTFPAPMIPLFFRCFTVSPHLPFVMSTVGLKQ